MSRRKSVALELVHCPKCGTTLFSAVNGITPGERCNSPIPAEFVSLDGGPVLLQKSCWGRWEKYGKLS